MKGCGKNVLGGIGAAGWLLTILAMAQLTGCEQKTEVAVINPWLGEIKESFVEPARTRLPRTYPVTMPVTARIGQVKWEVGDRVQKGQTLVELDIVPIKAALDQAEAMVKEAEAHKIVMLFDRLEMTAMEEARISVEAAKDALRAADAQVQAQEAREKRAAKELERMRKLAEQQAIPETTFDDAQLMAETELIELRKQELNRAVVKAMAVITELGPRLVAEYLQRKALERATVDQQVAQARAALAGARHELELAIVTSPIDGVVLERYQEGDGTLAVGTPILLLGNLEEMEVCAEVLTQDALRLGPDSEVTLDASGGLPSISGQVKRIEPAGFTKLSSLGVEQQRVRVIVSLDQRPEALGVAYRLHARFVTGRKDRALLVPRFSVLQAPDGSFYVFRAGADGVLEKVTVVVGLQSDLELEITGGLSDKDTIVRTPDATMRGGDRVKIASPQL